MERVIRTAVVGTRFMGRAHAAGIDDLNRYFHPGVRVEKAVLCGVDPAHTEQAAKTLGFSEFSTDYQSVLMRDDIDAVHICTPVFEHFSQAMAALLCKKHVFCEKPLTASLQGDTLVIAAETDFVLGIIKKPEIEALIRDKAAGVLKRPVAVRLTLKSQMVRAGNDPMDELVAFGGKHTDIFTIK